MALVVAQRTSRTKLDTSILYSQAGFHMRKAFSLYWEAICQSTHEFAERIGLVGLFYRVCSIADPVVHAAYVRIRRFSEYFSVVSDSLRYHLLTAWEHRRALADRFGFVFITSFGFQFVFLSLAKAAGFF